MNKHMTDNKIRLNRCCKILTFEPLRKIVQLSGSSLGQYLAFDSPAVIPETKLQLAELMCQKKIVK